MRESFFELWSASYSTGDGSKKQVEARMAIFEFLEGWYNPHRRHSALGYLSPAEFEKLKEAA